MLISTLSRVLFILSKMLLAITGYWSKEPCFNSKYDQFTSSVNSMIRASPKVAAQRCQDRLAFASLKGGSR